MSRASHKPMSKSLPDEGQRVRVYYNIPEDTLSVQNTNGIVIHHQDRVVIEDADFRVSEAGRQRVLGEECKNIHAKIHGQWQEECPVKCNIPVRYNPYEDGYFKTVEQGFPVEFSPWCIIEKNRCFIPKLP